MSGDPERDEKRPRPTAPAGVLNGPGRRPESAPVETGGRVPKSVFAHTIAGLQVPGATPSPAAQPESAKPPPNEITEPLRDPSERPAPTPFKQPPGQWGGTLPMPEMSNPGKRSAERMIAAKQSTSEGRQESDSVAVHAAAKVGTPAPPRLGEPTVRMPTTAAGALVESSRPSRPKSSPVPPAPPPSGAPPAPATPSARAAASKREDPSVPRLALGVEKIASREPATKLEATSQSQPLSLSLDARDHVEASLRPVATRERSPLPWIALVLLVVLGGLAFALTRGGDEPSAAPPERVEAVPAEQPATPEAQAATPGAAPDVPGSQTAEPQAPEPDKAATGQAAPAQVPGAPAGKDDELEADEADEVARPAATKRKPRKVKKPVTPKAAAPVLKVTPEGESSLEATLRAAERLTEPEDDLAPPEPPPPAEPPSPD